MNVDEFLMLLFVVVGGVVSSCPRKNSFFGCRGSSDTMSI